MDEIDQELEREIPQPAAQAPLENAHPPATLEAIHAAVLRHDLCFQTLETHHNGMMQLVREIQ